MNPKHTPPLLRETLEHFGIESNDCTFEMLKECAKNLHASPPSQRVVSRWHDLLIEKLVRPEDSLLDLGCGDGELLARLSSKKGCWLQGVEWEEDEVNRCIERGIPVCHADLEKILPSIPDKSYTWAVLENTLFTLKRPLDVVREMLRVAEYSVVTFPNFAHWSVRFTFSLGGRMPVTKALPYKWYDTPNIHLCSITDFLDVVEEWHLEVLHSWVLVEGETVPFDPATEQNITGEQALFVIRKRSSE